MSTIRSLVDDGIRMVVLKTLVGSMVSEGDESWMGVPKIMDYTGACLLIIRTRKLMNQYYFVDEYYSYAWHQTSSVVSAMKQYRR